MRKSVGLQHRQLLFHTRKEVENNLKRENSPVISFFLKEVEDVSANSGRQVICQRKFPR